MHHSFLALKNPHERDQNIVFDEGPHIYTIKGDKNKYTSVTTWNHGHFEHFDADKIISNMMSSKRWSESKYYGMSSTAIKESWDKNRDEAAAAGTKMHFDIECYYNQCPNENNSVEYSYFMKFLDDFPDLNKSPYRTEWMIYHEELRISGSVDMIFENPDGTLQIYDWKRCKDITKTTPFGKCGNKECIDHLPDTNYWHYCLQLNTYKAIIEEKYGKTVTDLYLVCLHPNNHNSSYKRIKVADLKTEIADLFALRSLEIIEENEEAY